MYRSFLRVVHLKSLLIFGSRLKRRVPFGFGADYPNKWLSAVDALAFVVFPASFDVNRILSGGNFTTTINNNNNNSFLIRVLYRGVNGS